MIDQDTRVRLHQVPGLITLAESDRLADLAAFCPTWAAIVEIGAHTGRSTVWLAAGAAISGAHVTTVDPWPEPGYTAHYEGTTNDDPFEFVTGQAVFEKFCDNVTEAQAWPYVTALRTGSLDAAAMWVNPVGVLFLDAMHGYDDVKADCEAWLSHVTTGGVVALHDWYDDEAYTHESQVADAFRDVAKTEEWEKLEITDNLYTARRL